MASTNIGFIALFAAVAITFAAAVPINDGVGIPVPVFGQGSCDDLRLQANFDIKEFAGVWYEIRRTPNFFEWDVRCTRANYTAHGDGFKVVKEGKTLWGYTRTLEAVGSRDNNKEARFNVTYTNLAVTYDYEVVMTDYKNYAVVRSCKDVKMPKDKTVPIEYWWLLGRAHNMEDRLIEEAYSKVPAMDRVKNFMKTVFQSRCFQDESSEE